MSTGHVAVLPPIFLSHHPTSSWVHLSWPVNSLGLSIPLGISWCRISICNSQTAAISSEGLAIKLRAIVRDEGVRDPESGDNVLLDKFLYIDIPNVCQYLDFYLFGEIINCYYHKPSVHLDSREWAIISKPHWAKDHKLETGLRFRLGRWMFSVCLWHWSHFLIYSMASLYIFNHQKPCAITR